MINLLREFFIFLTMLVALIVCIGWMYAFPDDLKTWVLAVFTTIFALFGMGIMIWACFIISE